MKHDPPRFAVFPSSGVPIYRQIMDQVRAVIASGVIKPGEMLPSVRQLASELTVNMMTVSKAYARLEAEGLITRDRGLGMRVADQTALAPIEHRKQELRPLADPLVTRSIQLGLTDQHVLDVVQKVLKERRS